jgi:ATP-dependent DNA helicase HFM1/MER3
MVSFFSSITINLTDLFEIVAPIKALCSERYLDWNLKFGPLGIKCVELTGDSDSTLSDYRLLLVK